MSAATNARYVGVPDDPLGEAKTKFADWDARTAVNVPDVVTGDPLTVKSAGKDNPTEVTVPVPPAAAQVGTPPANVNTYPFVLGDKKAVVPAELW